jgi:hypothetical protein
MGQRLRQFEFKELWRPKPRIWSMNEGAQRLNTVGWTVCGGTWEEPAMKMVTGWRCALLLALTTHGHALKAASSCESLSSLALPNTSITLAQMVPAGAFALPGTSPAAPQFSQLPSERLSTSKDRSRHCSGPQATSSNRATTAATLGVQERTSGVR